MGLPLKNIEKRTKKVAFDLSNYEPVADRITKFWEKYPNGRILTNIVERTDTDIIVRAEIYTDRDDERPAATDFAQETIGSSNITKHSWIETCSTSSIGRALANLGFSPKAGNRPSREEMTKVQRAESAPRPWLQEAEQYAGSRNREALLKLLEQAKQQKAPQSVIDGIISLGKTITPKEA